MSSISALAVEGMDGRSMPDAALVRAAQDDPTMFGALYHRYLDRVYAYLRVRTAVDEDAADLTQQVFLQALHALPAYRGGHDNAFAAWLFRIARHAAIDFSRRSHSTVTWDLVPVTLHPLTAHDSDAALIRREDLDLLGELVARLDPEDRDVLTLRFVARLSAAQIAVIVGKSEAATQKRLVRLIRSLKDQFHDSIR